MLLSCHGAGCHGAAQLLWCCYVSMVLLSCHGDFQLTWQCHLECVCWLTIAEASYEVLCSQMQVTFNLLRAIILINLIMNAKCEIIGRFVFVDVQVTFAVGSSMSCSIEAKDSYLQTV